MKEVYIGRFTRPNNPMELLSNCVLNIQLFELSLSVGRSIIYFYPCVHYRNPLVLLKKGLHSIQVESLLVDGEVLKVAHVINI